MSYDHNGEWIANNTINIMPTKIGLIKALRHMFPGLGLKQAKEIAEQAMASADDLTAVYTPEFIDKRNEVLRWAIEQGYLAKSLVWIINANNWRSLENVARDYNYPDPITVP
jgi:hypothetical protein